MRAAQRFIVYFERVIEERLREPQNDLISELVTTGGELDEHDRQQLVVNLILILTGGYESTANLIGNGMIALLRHPAQLELLRRRPDIIDDAVEEFLRYDSPLALTTRVASEDIALDDYTIPAGDQIAIMLGAANQTPTGFRTPTD